ncbi:hypothetical protein [Haloarchaeobius amylolyticus]|uniref:hypothetical protein n=1 Tax=Haloarchaeobius amylolyticus TaxID=1198296 RepID=UPI00226F9FFC|nr:hypothetical protein [Haloarchaeobius amylolyticus]
MTSKPGSSEEHAEPLGFIERLHRGLIGDAAADGDDERASRPREGSTTDETATSASDMDRSPRVGSSQSADEEDEDDGIRFAFDDEAAPHPSQRRTVDDEAVDAESPGDAESPDAATDESVATAGAVSDDAWQRIAADQPMVEEAEGPSDAESAGDSRQSPVTVGEVRASDSAASAAAPAGVAAALAAELTAGTVDDETREVLESHLGVGVDAAVAEEVQSLQERVVALETYADVLETELASSVADAQLATRVADMDDRVDRVDDRLDRIERSMREALLTVSDSVDRLDGQVRDADAAVEENRRQVARLLGWQRNLAETMATAIRVTPDEPLDPDTPLTGDESRE